MVVGKYLGEHESILQVILVVWMVTQRQGLDEYDGDDGWY